MEAASTHLHHVLLFVCCVVFEGNSKKKRSTNVTMLNQAVVEALYSATYIENYLDCVENLPNDLQRHVSRLRELDSTCQSNYTGFLFTKYLNLIFRIFSDTCCSFINVLTGVDASYIYQNIFKYFINNVDTSTELELIIMLPKKMKKIEEICSINFLMNSINIFLIFKINL